MKLSVSTKTKIYIATKPTDMRKAIDGLSVLAAELKISSLQSGHLFIFYNHARDKVKVLFWDKNGFVIYYKRLERGKFKFTKSINSDSIEIELQQLEWLLSSLDFMLMQEFPELNFEGYF